MNTWPNHLSAASGRTPGQPTAAHHKSGIPIRPLWLALCLALLAVLSTAAGFQVARFQATWAKWLSPHPVQAPSSIQPSPSLVSDSKPAAASVELEKLSHLAPQQQAERLLALAIHRDEFSLDLIRQRQDAWRGRLESTDRLFHLVLAALESEDPRVRAAAVEIDLAASNLSKSPQSVAHLLNQINNDPGSRSLTLWRLGALGNRGVEPATVLTTLLRYARDPSQQTRFWAVEGLAMLGTDESIDPLLSILAHDSSQKIRERAACNLARSGMLTGEQRLTAVPQLLNLLDDDSLDAATQDLVYAALRTITGASFGKDPEAWRDWWAHHDRPEKPRRTPRGLSLA
jgi:HEAT repeat protein